MNNYFRCSDLGVLLNKGKPLRKISSWFEENNLYFEMMKDMYMEEMKYCQDNHVVKKAKITQELKPVIDQFIQQSKQNIRNDLNCVTNLVQKQVDSKIKDITQNSTCVIPTETLNNIKQDMLKEIRCHSGVLGEEKFVKKESLQESNNTCTYKAILGTFPHEWGILGKVDGLKEDRVIEHKFRTRRFFTSLFPSELLQLQAYMFLTNRKHADLIQTRANSNDEKIISIEYDECIIQEITEQLQAWKNLYHYIESFKDTDNQYTHFFKPYFECETDYKRDDYINEELKKHKHDHLLTK